MHAKTLIATVLFQQAQFMTLVKTTVNTLVILGSMSGFFSNLYNDLTAFALAMATFFFGWAALLYMTANQNENQRVQARTALYVALGGLALAILAQAIAGLVKSSRSVVQENQEASVTEHVRKARK
jgi:predicted membrane channel-forming protein YqfA (hemolysin III family)